MRYEVITEMIDCEIERGEYQETTIDEQKKNADILITSIDGDYFTIFLNRDLAITSKRGVKKYSERLYAITESVLNKLKSQYIIATDF